MSLVIRCTETSYVPRADAVRLSAIVWGAYCHANEALGQGARTHVQSRAARDVKAALKPCGSAWSKFDQLK